MKSKLMRAICLVLCAAMMSLTFAACGSSSGSDANSEYRVGDYPARTIEVVSQFGSGGGTDIYIRSRAVDAGKLLGQSVVHLSAKGGCGEVEQQVEYQVIAIANESVVFSLLDKHLYITGNAVVLASITLAWYVDHHSLGYTCRDVDLHHFLTFLDTCTATVLTLVLDDLALAVTGGTYALLLHHAEDALCGVGDDT